MQKMKNDKNMDIINHPFSLFLLSKFRQPIMLIIDNKTIPVTVNRQLKRSVFAFIIFIKELIFILSKMIIKLFLLYLEQFN